MPNKPTSDVQQRDPDARAERTVRALRGAMAALLQEQIFRELTVQQILDRAGVSRAAFYSHFRNKDDALLSSYEGMFAALERHLDSLPGGSKRLVPMAELLSHLGESASIFASLRASDRMETIWALGTDLLADMILRRSGTQDAPAAYDPRLAARMLAGACIEMTKWWLDHPDTMSPQAMDDRFHQVARRVYAG